MFIGANLRTDTTKTCVLKEIGLHALNLLTILGSVVNKFRGLMCPYESLSMDFDNSQQF